MQLRMLLDCKFSPSLWLCADLVNLAELCLLLNPAHGSEAHSSREALTYQQYFCTSNPLAVGMSKTQGLFSQATADIHDILLHLKLGYPKFLLLPEGLALPITKCIAFLPSLLPSPQQTQSKRVGNQMQRRHSM